MTDITLSTQNGEPVASIQLVASLKNLGNRPVA